MDQVRQRKQAEQLGGVLGHTPVAHLAVTAAVLGYVERVLDQGTNLRLGLLLQRLEPIALRTLEHGLEQPASHRNQQQWT